jgi:hypothetical protein
VAAHSKPFLPRPAGSQGGRQPPRLGTWEQQIVLVGILASFPGAPTVRIQSIGIAGSVS